LFEAHVSKIAAQFAKPRGLFGRFVGLILANRPSNVRRAQWTVDRLALSGGGRVLEIGCGPGVALEACLSILTEGGVAVGVDHSDVMIKLAHRRNSLAVRSKRLKLITGTIDDVPADESPFDRIFSINVIQFIADKEAFVANCVKRLAPNGVVATTYQPRIKPSREAALAMAATLTELKARAGLTNIRTEVLELKPVPAICVLAQKA
jgi:2-polyprenyl-3-methyl-5-hydroxy-6-metoxy-1,4-benzoquinol methylase